jgi:hypothetical protein
MAEHEPDSLDDLEEDLEAALAKGKGPRIARAVLASFGGVPLAGGLFGAAAGAWSEAEQERLHRIFRAVAPAPDGGDGGDGEDPRRGAHAP